MRNIPLPLNILDFILNIFKEKTLSDSIIHTNLVNSYENRRNR